jgi:uncharacterized repeat protein (TIGR01451 family)
VRPNLTTTLDFAFGGTTTHRLTFVASGLPSSVAWVPSADGSALTQTDPGVFPIDAAVHSLIAFSAPSPVAGAAGTRYVLQGWTRASDGAPVTSPVTVTADETYRARYTPQYLLTVAASPSAAATTTSPGGGGWFDGSASVTVTADPVVAVGPTRYEFFQWAGDASGFSTSTTVVMAGAPKTATASYRAFADLSLTLTVSQNSVTVGDQLSYTATIANQGPSPATGVSLSIVVPAEALVTFASGCNGITSPLTCDLGYPLPSGASATYFIYVRTLQPGNLVVTATVTSTSTDPHLADNSVMQRTTVNPIPTPTATPTPGPTSTATPTAGPIGPTALSASPDRVLIGASTSVTWSGIASPMLYDWIGMYRVGDGDGFYLSYQYVDLSCTGASPSYPWAAGACSFTLPSTPGTYEFRLFTNSTYVRLATSNVVDGSDRAIGKYVHADAYVHTDANAHAHADGDDHSFAFA